MVGERLVLRSPRTQERAAGCACGPSSRHQPRPLFRTEGGEHLVGVGDPAFEEHRLVGLAAQFAHGAGQHEPVQQFVVAAVLRLLDGGVAPHLPVAVPQRLVVAAILRRLLACLRSRVVGVVLALDQFDARVAVRPGTVRPPLLLDVFDFGDEPGGDCLLCTTSG